LACPTFGSTWARTTCSTTRCAPERLALEAEAKRVLADRDHVAIGQLLLDHRLAVDQRAVGAAEVADPERAGPDLDPPVVPWGRGVADDHIVVGSAADRDHLAWQRDDASREGATLEGQQGRIGRAG